MTQKDSSIIRKVAASAGNESVPARAVKRTKQNGADPVRKAFIEGLSAAVRDGAAGKVTSSDIDKLVKMVVEKYMDGTHLSQSDLAELPKIATSELFGYGPIDPLMRDNRITDILVTRWDRIFVERDGLHQPVNTRFIDEAHLRKIVDRIVAAVGRRIDDSSPMVDARMEDGSRVNVIIPPLAVGGTSMSIRKFNNRGMTMQDLVSKGSLTAKAASFLEKCVKAHLNILVSGGTGSGKTTLLNVLSRFIGEEERIVTIEDAAELCLVQDDVVSLETRPPNMEGRGRVTQRDLVRNALRMRPDRILVGEARGEEALDLLQAMNTGHDGSMSTLHANKPKDALSRLEVLVGMGDNGMKAEHIKKYIASAINIVIQVSRLAGGHRRIVSVTEVLGMEGDEIVTQELFAFKRNPAEKGSVPGFLERTGIRSNWESRFEEAGI